MTYAVTDISDKFGAALRYPAPIFQDFGGSTRFFGQVKTLSTFEDNSLLRQCVETPGRGMVLVVDGGGSPNCALFGGNLAKLAAENGWAGIIIHGYVRDRLELQAEAVGIKALGTHPRKSEKRELGILDIGLNFAGIRINPQDWVYADEDGMVFSDRPLEL